MNSWEYLRKRVGFCFRLLALGSLLTALACERKQGESGKTTVVPSSSFGNAEAYSGIIKKYFQLDPRAVCSEGPLHESGFQAVIESTSNGLELREACSTTKRKLDESEVKTFTSESNTTILQIGSRIFDPLAREVSGGTIIPSPDLTFTDTIAHFSSSGQTIDVIIRAKNSLLAPLEPFALVTSRAAGTSTVMASLEGANTINIPVSLIETGAAQRIFNGTGIQLVVKKVNGQLNAVLKYNGQTLTTSDCQNTLLTPPPSSQAIPQMMMAAGADFSCAVKNGLLYCWGNGQRGQLGNGLEAIVNRPQISQGFGANPITRLTAGGQNVCAISAGVVSCWGDNSHLQTALPASIPYTSLPNALVALANIQDVAVGQDHVCSLSVGTTTNTVYCWGRNDKFQLGNSNTADQSGPEIVLNLPSDIVGLSAGSRHTCAIASNGDVYCWGDNQSGQLGNAAGNAGSAIPVKLAQKFTSIKSSGAYSCATDTSNAVWCWGSNVNGTVDGEGGTAVPYFSATPRKIQSLSSGVFQLALAPTHACGLKDGSMYCWGRNDNSLTGNANSSATLENVTKVISLTPIYQFTLGGFSDLMANYFHTLVLSSDGLHSWGEGVNGQLGDGRSSSSTTPVAISFP